MYVPHRNYTPLNLREEDYVRPDYVYSEDVKTNYSNSIASKPY